jgi:inorganic triphosphatase YgiF
LRPAFNVRVSRRLRTFRYHGAEIELALDQGEVTGGDRRSEICEVELELKSGPPQALFALARELSAAAPLYLTFDSKAARGQALVAGRPQPTPRKSGKVALADDATVGEALQAIARRALAQIAGNATVLRVKPGPEAVHQLRVGVRRLRSATATFKPLLAGEALEPLKTELKWLGHACDAARGLDVFAAETLHPAEQDEHPPPGLPALRKAIDAARRTAWAQAREAAASDRFRALMIDATAWVETGGWREAPDAGAPIKPFAKHALKRHLKKLRRRGLAAQGGDDTARHHLRIEAKKLRYAAEGLAGLYGRKRVERYLEELKGLQEVLGDLNDLASAEPLIARLKLSPEAAFAAGELVGRKTAAKPRLLTRAGKALGRLDSAEPFWR